MLNRQENHQGVFEPSRYEVKPVDTEKIPELFFRRGLSKAAVTARVHPSAAASTASTTLAGIWLSTMASRPRSALVQRPSGTPASSPSLSMRARPPGHARPCLRAARGVARGQQIDALCSSAKCEIAIGAIRLTPEQRQQLAELAVMRGQHRIRRPWSPGSRESSG